MRLSDILTAGRSGTLTQPSESLRYRIFERGDFFERSGKRLDYIVDGALETIVTWEVGIQNPQPQEMVNGNGTVLLIAFRINREGDTDLDPFPFTIALPRDLPYLIGAYGAQERVRR